MMGFPEGHGEGLAALQLPLTAGGQKPPKIPTHWPVVVTCWVWAIVLAIETVALCLVMSGVRDIDPGWILGNTASFFTALTLGASYGSSFVKLFLDVVFLSWFYETYGILKKREVPLLSFAPQWTFFGYWIPIAQFFIPYQMMGELWKASDSRLPWHSPLWLQNSSPWQLPLWWFTWLLLLALNSIFQWEAWQRWLNRSEPVTLDHEAYHALTLLIHGLELLMVALTLVLVIQIHHRLIRKCETHPHGIVQETVANGP